MSDEPTHDVVEALLRIDDPIMDGDYGSAKAKLDAIDALHRTLTEDEAKRTKIGWDIRRTDGSRVSWCSCGTKDCPTRAILDGEDDQ